MFKIYPPALIYLVFSLIQIIIDTFRGFYNTAFIKSIIMIMVTLLLNALSEQGLDIVAWIIIFIPFMLMAVTTVMILYIFGLNSTTGKSINNKNKIDIIPAPLIPSNLVTTSTTINQMPPYYSSSPEYVSGQ